jgi:hypothetical protein
VLYVLVLVFCAVKEVGCSIYIVSYCMNRSHVDYKKCIKHKYYLSLEDLMQWNHMNNSEGMNVFNQCYKIEMFADE